MESVLFVISGALAALATAAAARRLLGFAAQKPDDYATRSPQFDLRKHLNGPIDCEGVIYGPTGRVTSRFRGDFFAIWHGKNGVMHERFTYDSGTVQEREWQLRLAENGKIAATAADVIGQGRGVQNGSAVQLKYRIRLPPSAGGHVLDVVDWMYLAPGGAIVNRSQFRKFGITVAELVAVMRPAQPEQQAA